MKGKVKGFYEKHKTAIDIATVSALYGAGWVAAYALGEATKAEKFDIGMSAVLERHPELNEPLMNAIKETAEYYND